jgi:hypothetical protein
MTKQDLIKKISDKVDEILQEVIFLSYSPEYFSQEASRVVGRASEKFAKELEKFQKGHIEKNFLDFLKNYQKKEIPDIDRYKLQRDMWCNDGLCSSFCGNHIFDNAGYDGMFSFCLAYDDELIASLGFNLRSGKIKIIQIQGRRGNKKRLKNLKWTHALVDYCCKWAFENNVPIIEITSADDHRWVNTPGHLKYNQAKLLYDATAKKCGFSRNDFRNYFKINPSNLVSDNFIVQAGKRDKIKVIDFLKKLNQDFQPNIEKWDKKGIEGVVEMIYGNLSKIFIHPDKDGNIEGMLSYWHESIDDRLSAYVYFFGISEQRKGTSLSRNLVLESLKEMRSQGIIKIRAGIYSYKKSMRKVAERFGFKQIGTYQEIYGKYNKNLLVYQTHLPVLLEKFYRCRNTNLLT